jgi:hypothetical protein
MGMTEEIRMRYRAMAVVAAALMGAVAIYAVLVEFLARSGNPPAPGDPSVLRVLRPVLTGLGILMLPAIWVLRGRFLVKREGDAPESLATRMMTATILTGALAESAAVFGLVLFLLGGERTDFYVLAVWSLLLQFGWFPTLRRFEEYVKGGRPKI